MTTRYLADVAELADAQVSEACDGDIVEVQVLSSAPTEYELEASLLEAGLAVLYVWNTNCRNILTRKIFVTDFRRLVFS